MTSPLVLIIRAGPRHPALWTRARLASTGRAGQSAFLSGNAGVDVGLVDPLLADLLGIASATVALAAPRHGSDGDGDCAARPPS